jgi:hypothetical protein
MIKTLRALILKWILNEEPRQLSGEEKERNRLAKIKQEREDHMDVQRWIDSL